MTPATASVPSGPTNLTVTPGSTGATLHWTASTSGSPTSYSIYRGTATDGEAVTPVGTVSGTTTTFTDTGLTNGKTYFYNVAANNSVGVSPDSNEVSVSPGAATTAPPAPTGLAANPADSSIDLTWNPSAGATSYSIYRGTAPGAEGATPVGTTTSDSFTDTGLTNGTGYYYTVAASNTGGASAKSAETNTVPTAAVVAPPVPFGVVITTAPGQIQPAMDLRGKRDQLPDLPQHHPGRRRRHPAGHRDFVVLHGLGGDQRSYLLLRDHRADRND